MKTMKLLAPRRLQGGFAGALLAFAAMLFTGCGGPDSLSGYYTIQVNPAPDASPDKLSNNMVFGFDRLVFNENHTYRLGFLRGEWSRSGDTVTLDPKSKPSVNAFYAQTSMAATLSILLNKTDLKISLDEKKLTAVNAPHGPLVFSKSGDVMQ